MGQPVEILINLKKTGEGGKQAEQELSGVQKAAKMAGAALGAMATVETVKAAYEFAKLGAQSIRTRNAFEAISGGADEASERLAAMQRATRGAISEQAAMESANRLMQMGLANNAQELEKVTTMAVRLGTAMGRDAGASIEEFALLLANQSIPRLDTFGISAGKTRQQINELMAANAGMSRETAFMTAVMAQGEEALAKLGPAMEDDLLAAEQLEASWADLKAMVAEQVAPAMATLVGGLADVTREVVEQRKQMEEYTRVLGEDTVKAIVATANVTADMTDEERMLAEASYMLGDSVVDQAQVLERLEKEYQAVTAASNLSKGQMNDYAEMAAAAAGSTDLLTAASVTATESQTELATSAGKVAKSFGEMEFDDEALWKLALASGASLESLSQLAIHLGIATDAEVQNTLEGYRMVEAFAAGEMGASELSQGFYKLSAAERNAEQAGKKLSSSAETVGEKAGLAGEAVVATSREIAKMDKILDMADQADSVGTVADQFDEMQDRVDDTTRNTDDFDRAAGRADVKLTRIDRSADLAAREVDTLGKRARDAATYLESIPREIVVTIKYVEEGAPPDSGGTSGGGGGRKRQVGTPFWLGGAAIVGEGGPELAVLPRGTAISPAWEARSMIRQTSDNRIWNRGGDTIIVQDPLAAAMVLEERRRGVERRIARGF